MLTRFELFIVLRSQVADRARVKRAVAVEAAMEALAEELGANPVIWGLAGLGADIDCAFAAGNPERRGHVARELLLTEGAPAEVADAVRDRAHESPERMTPLAAGLGLADALVDAMLSAAAEDGLDGVDAQGEAIRLGRSAERRGDAIALRALACAARVGVTIERGAEVVLAALRRARQDVGL
jgi:predicted hydrolase (HD superfamily)